MDKDTPTPEMLRMLLCYEPDTGKLFWRERDASLFADNRCAESAASVWNKRFAGKEAFTATKKGGYKHGSIFYSYYSAHRVAWAIHYGCWPDMEVDHINGVPSDNRITNLRDVTPSTNKHNTAKPSNNKSGVCGVYWIKRHKKWGAQIKTRGKFYWLGQFDTIEEAAAARKAAEKKYGFTKRHGQ